MTTNQRSADAGAPPITPGLRSTQRKQRLAWVALIGVLLLGGYFRTLGLFSWDDPSYRLHPDERFMTDVASLGRVPASLGQYLDSARNSLNPRNNGKDFYVYGLLPQTLTRLAAVMLTPDSKLPAVVPETHADNAAQIPNPELRVPKLLPLQLLLNPTGLNLTEYGEIHKVGRAWSALFDIGSLLLVFLIGRRLYGRRVALLAALLMAGAVLPIQLAHFFTVDSITAFFTLLTVYWAVRLAQGGRAINYIPLGLSIGIAMACRVTMAALPLLAALVAAQRIWYRVRGGQDALVDTRARPASSGLFRASAAQFVWLALAGVMAFLAFRMLQPDAFLGTSTLTPTNQAPSSIDRLLQGRGFFDIRPDPRFIENYRTISEQFSGEADWPPSQQWASRTRYVFALQNMVIWGMGLPLGLMAWAGWAIAGWQILRRRKLVHLVPWAWVTFFFAWQGGQAFMTMRYYSMLYGLLIMFAAWLLIRIVDYRLQIADWARGKSTIYNLQSAIRWLPLLLVVLVTFCWAYAFTRIYTQPHSRITASRWIYANVPAGAAITSEEWDDGLPLDLDGYSHDRYIGIQTKPYAEDDESKYIGSVDKDGKRVPGLFDQLDQADYIVLSSNRVYGSAPRLPMRYPALTRYYHYLFSGELGFTQVADITSYPSLFGIPIPDQSAEEAFTVYDHPRVLIFKKNASYSRANTERLIAGDVAWDEVYKLPTMRVSRVPTALRLTEAQWPGFRAAGTWAALFDPASLSNQAPVLIWLLVLELIGLAAFPLLFCLLPGLPDRGFALAKTLALLLVAYGAWLLGSFHLLAFTPASVWLCAGLLIAAGAAVGWRVRRELLAFVWRRIVALIMAEQVFLLAWLGFVLIRALNPDLWHPARGGEKPIDLAFLTAVLKSPAFPSYDPWFAGGYLNFHYFGYVLVGALIHLTGIVPTTAYNLAVPTLFALTALGAWGVAYNLVGTGDWGLGTRSWRSRSGSRPQSPILSPQHLRREWRAIVAGGIAVVFVVLAGNLLNALFFLGGYAAQNALRPEWVYWDAVHIGRLAPQANTINEFPFFTFLYGDLQPHMIALPLALAALELMVALVRRRTKNEGRTRLRVFVLGLPSLVVLALVIGALRATNGWDYPIYLALAVATLGIMAHDQYRRGATKRAALAFWAMSALGLLVLSSILFLPFTQHYVGAAGLRPWLEAGTSAAELLKINGLWLFVLVSAGLLLSRHNLRASRLRAGLGAGIGALLLIAAMFDTSALVILVPLAAAATWLAFAHVRPRSPASDILPARSLSPASQQLIVWVLAALVAMIVSEILVAPDDVGRQNTVLNLGMQSWVLLACASAPAFVWLWRALAAQGRPSVRGGRFALGWAWRGTALLLIAAALVYPISATPARIADRFDARIGPTLDGMAFMRTGIWAEHGRQFPLAEDAAAIEWMRAHIGGTPIVLEAQTDPYRWAGRVSAYTGLPTLLGWSWHEYQQRGVALANRVIASREQLIKRLYAGNSPGEVLHDLQLYGVEYVYVGQLERALYPAAGLAHFDALAQSGQIQVVYHQGATQIYRVPPAAHAPAVLETTLPVGVPR